MKRFLFDPCLAALAVTAILGCSGRGVHTEKRATTLSLDPVSVLHIGGPTEHVYDIACSPDGEYAVINCAAEVSEKTVRVVGLSVMKNEGTFSGFHGRATSVALSPNGEYLAIGSHDGVEVWDFKQRRLFRSFAHESPHACLVVFSPCGRYIYTANTFLEGVVRRLDTQTGEARVIFGAADEKLVPRAFGMENHSTDILSLAVSPDGHTLAIAVASGTVLWDLESNRLRLAVDNHEGAPLRLAFSPDGSTLALATTDVELWDHRAGTRRTILPTSLITAMIFSPDGEVLVTSRAGLLQKPSTADIWRVRDGHRVGSFTCHGDVISAMAFVPGTRKLLMGSVDGVFKVCNLDRIEERFEAAKSPGAE